MWGRLAIFDMGRELRVAPIDDPDDWVVCFAKESGFPAQEWADRMIALYNADPVRQRTASGGAENTRHWLSFYENGSAEPLSPVSAAGLPARRV